MQIFNNKEEDYITISINGDVYLISNNYVVALKPSPKSGNKTCMYIDERFYNTLTNFGGEKIEKMANDLVYFSGRTISYIIDRIDNEFILTDLND